MNIIPNVANSIHLLLVFREQACRSVRMDKASVAKLVQPALVQDTFHFLSNRTCPSRYRDRFIELTSDSCLTKLVDQWQINRVSTAVQDSSRRRTADQSHF